MIMLHGEGAHTTIAAGGVKNNEQWGFAATAFPQGRGGVHPGSVVPITTFKRYVLQDEAFSRLRWEGSVGSVLSRFFYVYQSDESRMSANWQRLAFIKNSGEVRPHQLFHTLPAVSKMYFAVYVLNEEKIETNLWQVANGFIRLRADP